MIDLIKQSCRRIPRAWRLSQAEIVVQQNYRKINQLK